MQGYDTLKSKYMMKPWQLGSTLDQTSISFRNTKTLPKGKTTQTMDSPEPNKRQVSFERFDFTKIPIQDQDTKTQEQSQVKGKTILKSPSSKQVIPDAMSKLDENVL